MILAADTYKTNSQLMLACRQLGYLSDMNYILDVTYGKGTWWKDWTPLGLHPHDLKLDGVDFTNLPEATSTVDAVCFDPPYVAVGGRKTTTIGDFNDAYGLDAVPATPDKLHDLICSGLEEAWRVLKPKGICLFKAMNYVSSGRYQSQAYDALRVATGDMFRLKDEFIHLRRPGPQPRRDGQKHARRNYSHLFVLEARK